LGELSSSFDNSTYVGNSDNSGRFVGNTSSDLNQASQTSNRASSLKNLKSSGTGNTMTPTATESLLFKPRMHVSFSYQAKPNPQMSMVMTQKLALKNQLKGVQVDSNYDGAMVLKGTVASQEHKDLAEMYLRLEPGVEKVVNNISIAPALEAPTR
jgi:osmotically-inducible protein OsmY